MINNIKVFFRFQPLRQDIKVFSSYSLFLFNVLNRILMNQTIMVTHSRSHDSPHCHEIFNVDSLIKDVGITTLLFHLGPGHVNGTQQLKKPFPHRPPKKRDIANKDNYVLYYRFGAAWWCSG